MSDEIMDEKYQYDYPNSHYLSNMDHLNSSNQKVQLNRLPTMSEILANKTQSPVSLHDFYNYMKDIENNSDYIDFWFDLVNHFNLCKHYVKGLRDSIVRHSSHHESRGSTGIVGHPNTSSVTSSMLLDLILDDNLLQENDSNRLSQFLRGDLEVNPRLSRLMSEYDKQHSPKLTDMINPSKRSSTKSSSTNDRTANNSSDNGIRVSSASKLLEADDSYVENQLDEEDISNDVFGRPKYMKLGQNSNTGASKRVSSITPGAVEKLIRNNSEAAPSTFITREKLKESTQNLLLKYILEDSEKYLNLPDKMNTEIINFIEIQGRDDPELFRSVRAFVFNQMENYYLPNFLNLVAIRNINRAGGNILLSGFRIFLGFFLFLIGFWIGYIFIFLNYKKSHRLYIIIPFLFGSYCLVSSIYLVDPLLVWLGYSQSLSRDKFLTRIEEKFIHKILLKRSIWVSSFILGLAAVFVIIFSLVPGHRL